MSNTSQAKAATLEVKRLQLPLQEHERNPRQHPKPGSEEWELLRASLNDSYFDPIVWNSRNGKLVSGHLRQKVLLAEGYTECDCVVVDWPEDQHLARMIAANRGMGEDDEQGLRLILEDLSQSGYDLQLTGLTDDVFSAISFITPEVRSRAEQAANVPHAQQFSDEEIKRTMQSENSYTKLVQLFFTVETYPEFEALLLALKAHYGTENTTTTVMQAMRNENAQAD